MPAMGLKASMAGTSPCFTFHAAQEADSLRLAAWLAGQAKAGWLIFLKGDLGAGKTAFARGFIKAKCGPKTRVPSPSFTLVQPYETCTPAIIHSDLYRLSEASEVEELGLLDALESDICLLEWASRAEGFLPDPTVSVTLSLVEGAPDARQIIIEAAPEIIAPLKAAQAREAALQSFLAQAGWGAGTRAPLAGDASTRRYERLTLPDGRQGVLMDWAKGPDGPAIYDGKPYSQVAHLAEAMPAYCAMVDWLGAHGLSSPDIWARDEAQGFALMEDFGDRHIAMDETIDRAVFYREAVSNLLHLHQSPAAEFLAPYDGKVQAVEADLFTQWYLPYRGIEVSPAAAQSWHALWEPLGDTLLRAPRVSVLRDYHSVNLLWREGAQARFRVGLIDVQDALAGHAAYDLSSLLCDARVDVAPELQAAAYEHYCATRFGADEPAREAFQTAYAICAVQRNLKIAGIFVRLSERDHKPGYLKHLPRVLGYLESHMAHPALAPVAHWLEAHAPDYLGSVER
jgi:tRNA threonylcarbamoyl adenosine modification protein YjeE